MKINRVHKIKSVIPVASMSDIAFLLLIFMLLSSILTSQPPLKINEPIIKTARELSDTTGLRFYLTTNRMISINDQVMTLDQFARQLPLNLADEQQVYLHADGQSDFEAINMVLEALKLKQYKKLTLIAKESLKDQ